MKNNIAYKVFNAIFLIFPMLFYLAFQMFNTKVDYNIKSAKIEELAIVNYNDDSYFIYDNKADKTAIFNIASPFNGEYGIVVKKDSVVRVGFNLYNINAEDNQFKKISKFGIEKQLSYKIPVFMIIAIAVVFVVLKIVLGRLKYDKDKWRGYALLSLTSITFILTLIEYVLASALFAFYVSLLSYGAYYVNWKVREGRLSSSKGDVLMREIDRNLLDALERMRK